MGKRCEKLVLAVRSSHGLEVPLTDDTTGRVLVSREYFDLVITSANRKMAVNEDRHRKFGERLRDFVQS